MPIKKLPTKKKTVDNNFHHYMTLLYGREKIGKSTMFSQFPNILFISTEPGTKVLEIYETPCENWKDIRQVVNLLEREKMAETLLYENVVIDTADRAYDFCLEFICRNDGVEHPSDQNDYGKTWNKVKNEFTNIIHRLNRLEIGVCFTSHAQEVEIKTKSGAKYDRIYPSMSKQARIVIEALVDFFFYVEYMQDINGNDRRIIYTQGDESIWAGCRLSLPKFIELTKTGMYEKLLLAFNGENNGIDLAELRTTRQTSSAFGNLVSKVKSAQEKISTKIDEKGVIKSKPKSVAKKRI